MSGPDGDPDDGPPKEPVKDPAWITRLASLASKAPAGHKAYRDSRWGNSKGAASEGKRLVAWTCACGWTGPARELKAERPAWPAQPAEARRTPPRSAAPGYNVLLTTIA